MEGSLIAALNSIETQYKRKREDQKRIKVAATDKMKDIVSPKFTNPRSNNVVFDIVKDDKLESDLEMFLTTKTFGLEIESYLKKRGYKLVFNHIENNNEMEMKKPALDLMFSCTSFNNDIFI